MAQMFPPRIGDDTASAAERKLFRAFQEQLDDDYLVFHHVNWHGRDEEGRPRDGEADFVIAHPQGGVLVLEAKGGEIVYERATQSWWSIGGDGKRHRLKKSPIEQAMICKHRLAQEFRAMPALARAKFLVGHAIAFSDVPLPAQWSEWDIARELVLDKNALRDVNAWTRGAMDYWRADKTMREVSPAQLRDALFDLLGKTIELRTPLWSQFNDEAEQIVGLTREQYRVLDHLNRQRRAKICGCAGSGKTMLAAEKARRLGAQGFKVLLTCYNRFLEARLKKQLRAQSNVTVMRFHAVCEEFAKRAQVLPPKGDDQTYYAALPDALELALKSDPTRYDAVIIDEGQDFRAAWWKGILQLLKDRENGIFYLFYDDNQRIYSRDRALPIQGEAFPLTRNCRNTKHIHEAVTQFYQSQEQPEAVGPLGAPIEYQWYETSDELRARVDEILIRLIEKENIPSNEIAVLTALNERSALSGRTTFRGPALTKMYPPPAGQVIWTTISAFKGLEASIVILAEMDQAWMPQWKQVDFDRLLYVGCSRAKHQLFVLLNRKGNADVHRAFGKAGLVMRDEG